MTKRIIWLLVSCLMALILVMVSCAPAPTATTAPTGPATTTAPAAPTAPTAPTTTAPAAKAVERPKYGGVLRVGRDADIFYFDDVLGIPYMGATLMVTNNTLWAGDWAKGPAGGYGTNETSWDWITDRWEHKTGYLAESWNIPNKIEGETATIYYNIRKGVRWALNPNSEASKLVNGREMTADDVVFSIKQVLTDTRAWIYRTHPEMRGVKVTATDKWTVKVEVPWEAFETAVGRFSDNVHIVPPEVVQKLGDMNDWKRSVGTGPFMLTDFVKSSVAVMQRNPNHFMTNPVGPGKGDRLPYVDEVRLLILPDASTRLAALRTAKIDWLSAITMDDAASLTKTTPQLRTQSRYPSPTTGLGMNTTKVPFNDIRVRRALMMALDFEGINKNLYQGKAMLQTWPIVYEKEYAGAYLGLDDPEMPASAKELYSYNPEKAKALLKEAGYPQGFKTTAIISNTGDEIDYYSVYKDMWSKIGVIVELKPTEEGAKRTAERLKTHEGFLSGAGSAPTSMLYRMVNYYGPGAENKSVLDDSYVKAKYPEMQRLAATDRAAADRLHKEMLKYILDQAWTIPRLSAPQYHMWWPWLKNYSGEVNVGYLNRHFYTWVWIDQDLKKSMGY